MEPSTYAVCQAAKWLKSSVEKLSDNSRSGSLWILEGAQNDIRSADSAPFVSPNEGAHGATAIYQTVSRRVILRTSPKRRSQKFVKKDATNTATA